MAMEQEDLARIRLQPFVQKRSKPAHAQINDEQNYDMIDPSGNQSPKHASEGETSNSSSAFHTPASGSSESIRETGFETPVPPGAMLPTSKMTSEPIQIDLGNLKQVTRRPAKHRTNNKEDLSTKPIPLDIFASTPTCLHSSLPNFPDQGKLFSRMGQGAGTEPFSSKGLTSNVFYKNGPSSSKSSTLAWNPPSVSRNCLQPPSSSSVEGHKEKSSSPSGLSQSSVVSGMEWDPSADVELGSLTYQQVPPPPSNKSESVSLGTLPINSDKSDSLQISSEDPGSGADTSRRLPGPSSWRDSVSVEISLDPRNIHPRSKSEVGNNHLVVVDRSVQAGSSLKCNQSNESLSAFDRDKSHDSRRSNSQSHRSGNSQGIRMSRLLEYSKETSRSGESSSDLTPTCSFIKQMANSDGVTKDPNFLDAIYTHRQEHIGNVKRELRRIQALSQLLCGKSTRDSTSISTSFDSEEHVVPKVESKQRIRETVPRKRHIKSPERSTSGCPQAVPPYGASVSKNTTAGGGQEGIEEIMRAFRQLLENFIPGEVKPNESSSGRVHRSACSAVGKGNTAPVKRPVSYFLPVSFSKTRYPTNSQPYSSDKENEQGAESTLVNVNIQKVLAENHPEFVKRANERRKLLAQVRNVRQKRAALTRNWIENHGTKDLFALESVLPTKGPRIMSSKEMKKQTVEKYMRLPEVQEKKLKLKERKEKETNRLLSSYFSGKLRQGVLKGKVNVDLNRSVIRK